MLKLKTFIFLLCSLSTISKNTVNENFRIKELVVPKFAQVGLCTAKQRKILSFNVLTLFEFGLNSIKIKGSIKLTPNRFYSLQIITI